MTFFIVLLLSVFADIAVTSGKYGDIDKIPTTGASLITAQQYNISYAGVEASRKMAENDLDKVNEYKPIIQSVAQNTGMDAAVIAGIISRESRAGRALKTRWRNNKNAYGLMQVNKKYDKIEEPWNSDEHITQATEILISMCNSMQKKFSSASEEIQLKGAIAACNCGPEKVKNLLNVDEYTTGGDYSNDVVARAMYYRTHGY